MSSPAKNAAGPAGPAGAPEAASATGTILWIEIEPSLFGVRYLGAAVRGVCAQVLTEDAAAEMDLVVAEAATNVVKYGFAGRTDGRLRVRMTVADAFVELVLRDNGQAFDPLSTSAGAPWDGEGYDSFEAMPEGGFGIALIRALTDSASYRRDGNENVLTLRKSVQG